ncbi:thioredoxin family protein [Flammeovirga agarivorans]|uniref:Thioredoxin family protein n=1 Tax=Flammeovirga agarivorans TaxID=2726742 RepID=A0A7X8XUW9_9BACT|nr:thioredoxin family protein [Flammeovirga agarivorans]NLR90797.1 thioredoxin family protein [Flammeovirga agarivorans]
MAENQTVAQEYIDNAFVYDTYREALDALLAGDPTIINYEDSSLVDYTRLNVSRMQRIDKTNRLLDGLRNAGRALNRSVFWLVITEGWCGDAAQSIPIIAEAAQVSEKIDLRFILRDNNVDLMEQFLTNGSRSIPKLLMICQKTNEVLATWGPRPQELTDLIPEIKKAVGEDKQQFSIKIQQWYNKNKGKAIMKDLEALLNGIS